MSRRWTSDPVDRSGAARYTHLIRAADDPSEVSRKVRQASGV